MLETFLNQVIISRRHRLDLPNICIHAAYLTRCHLEDHQTFRLSSRHPRTEVHFLWTTMVCECYSGDERQSDLMVNRGMQADNDVLHALPPGQLWKIDRVS